MPTERFDFASPAGYALSGQLEIPESAPRGWAIFAHCLTCGKNSLAATRVSRALAKIGIGVLRFDFAGLGTSGGRFADHEFAADALDLMAAGEAMKEVSRAPGILIGHSLGGAAALAAAAGMPTVRAVVTIGAPSDIQHALSKIDSATLEAIHRQGEGQVLLGERYFQVNRRFVEGFSNFDLGARIASMHRALLVLHSPVDDIVGIDHARRIFETAHHPKSFISLDGADHLLTHPADAEYVAALVAAWVGRYLGPANPAIDTVRGEKSAGESE
jgi:uncharacterized protein